jgi:hypothetical protein
LDNAHDHAEPRRDEKVGNSMAVFRLRGLLLCLIALFALTVAFGVQAGMGMPSLSFPQAWFGDDARSAITLVTDKPADQPGYTWSATRIDSGIRLRGSVPSDDDRRIVLGMVKAHFPDLEVEDRLKIAAGAPPQDQWLGAVSFSLKQLAHLKRGSVRLLDVTLRLEGEARSGADYAEVKKALAGSLPTGLDIAGSNLRPPVADPFVFMADLDANALSLSGSVPSEDSRQQVRELSRQLFRRPGLDDRLELASGAPKNWDAAVAAALRALSQLESGKIALSGLAVTIQGVAPDKGTAVAVSYQLRRDLPDLFSTTESISWKQADAAPDFSARVLPRIKAMASSDDPLPTGGLPQLLQLFDGE